MVGAGVGIGEGFMSGFATDAGNADAAIKREKSAENFVLKFIEIAVVILDIVVLIELRLQLQFWLWMMILFWGDRV